ncbi:MAG TPA: PmeII family type II restriction endonuclease [Saprospiraceae bacterium]|nr:PmeII family type II restriction endonuclease [Saprospiraceae bacterium]HND87137.1 PmeII family type II restriction endonuclease [Saprospiraceae bacterium]HNG89042.1 PmeII family type II restriction endonuclease [Saprospiraceae bacterium]
MKHLRLDTVLRKKNPYLFKAKYLLTAEQVVRSLADAFTSSNEETIFGDWLEGLAICINQQVFGGRKSGITGIDLEFDREGTRFIVNIKSGPNWGNSSQIEKMRSDFKSAAKTLRTSGGMVQVVAVNGCSYGRDDNPDKGDYYKYCGQRFWEFISGDTELYTTIMEPVGHRSKEKNEAFQEAYAKMISLFTLQFAKEFCSPDGGIDWGKLVRFNSAK